MRPGPVIRSFPAAWSTTCAARRRRRRYSLASKPLWPRRDVEAKAVRAPQDLLRAGSLTGGLESGQNEIRLTDRFHDALPPASGFWLSPGFDAQFQTMRRASVDESGVAAAR